MDKEAPFDLVLPRRRDTSAVFASPHSGRDYPAALLDRSILSPHALRSSEDAFVDRLFAAAPANGAPLLAARLPRAWVDLNRAEDELDPALIEGARRNAHNPRIASGLGVVPRVVAGGRAIYRGKLTMDEARARLEAVWGPYHAALRQQIDATRTLFGEVILLDCHSMPHEAIAPSRNGRPDVVLGDRFGAAASGEVVDGVEAAFVRGGFSVTRNAPFAGAFMAQHYGRPAGGQHVVQIEIDRALYMDEARITTHSGFSEIAARLGDVIAAIAELGRRGTVPVAAE